MFSAVKEILDLKTVIGSVVRVDRYGRALCPFHDDHRPSLSIRGRRWRCFGCGEHGDVFDFYEKYFGISRSQALDALAEKAGLAREKTTSPETKRKIAQARARRYEHECFVSWIYHMRGVVHDSMRKFDEIITKRITPANFDLPGSAAVIHHRTYLEYLSELLRGTEEEKYSLWVEAGKPTPPVMYSLLFASYRKNLSASWARSKRERKPEHYEESIPNES